uniref:Metacaspase n=1 Tax=Kalanchoe fedtschenkoi TaxID=63787 RepID=A0A7N1A9K7_KALFE
MTWIQPHLDSSSNTPIGQRPMDLSVNCANCHTELRLPQGATSLRCVICQAVTQVDVTVSPVAPPIRRMPAGHLQVHGPKRAVICAVSYKKTKNELKGCVNDANCMKFLLINRFSFPEASVLMLNEDETDPYKIPTKENIRLAMHWLIQGCRPGDSLVFHFSGHGLQKKDLNGDEIDGLDETLCPMDFETEGVILDDEINDRIVRPVPHGVKLHAIIDACHSGTVLDLPYLCRMKKKGEYAWEDHRPRNGASKGTSGGEVIAFSGCDDDQTSADTTELSKVTTTGAMTYSFIEAIERGHGATYGSILTAMRATIHDCLSQFAGLASGSGSAGAERLHLSEILTMLLSGGHIRNRQIRIQEPQLTVTEPFYVFTRPFSL